jgi:hypothetical protein
MKRAFLSVFTALFIATAVSGQPIPKLAEAGLQPRIDVLRQLPATHGFELGMLSALRAIEKTLQTRNEYGLGDRLMALPMLRVELGARNPAAKTFTPDTLSDMMRTLLQDMDVARGHLRRVAEGGGLSPLC